MRPVATAICAALCAALATQARPAGQAQSSAVAQPPLRFSASITAAAHRIPLPPGAASVRFSPFTGLLEIRSGAGKPMQAELPGLYATPCKQLLGRETTLSCSTGRLEVALSELRGRKFLDLNELRGLPTAPGEEGPPEWLYEPEMVGLGAPCPGNTAAGRAECALQRGDLAAAESELLVAIKREETYRYAGLRLGDIALRRGEPDDALERYQKASGEGSWGRLARERLCELTGNCLWDPRLEAYDASRMFEPQRSELQLRELRTLTILRRWPEVSLLFAALANATCVARGAQLCRAVLLTLLRAQGAPRELALEAYMWLPLHTGGPLAAPLARAAAAAAGDLGAPAFGATLLAATTRESTPADLPAHLRQNISLYLQAGDRVRADVVAEFAKVRLPAQGSWELPPLPPPAPQPLPSVPMDEQAAITAETTEGMLAVARATLQRARYLPGVMP